MRVTFGAFTFDSDRRLLARGTESVHLGPKAFDLLRILLEHRPNVVPKGTLIDRLWPDTFVADNSLATLINDLRTAVGDDARDPQVIRTAHGVGYAFVANAAEPDGHRVDRGDDRPLSDWLLIFERTSLPLFAGENIIGRPAPGVIGLDGPTVSRQHARIVITGDRATVEDLGSKNGTWLGSTRIIGPQVLNHGDEIRFGLVLTHVVRRGNDVSTKTAVGDEPEATQDISIDS
jgi:DNA-binding winged helix-turn-helix (wHTH) protein